MTDSERPKPGPATTARIVEMQREPTVRVSSEPVEGNLAVDAAPVDPEKPERLIGRIVAGRYEVRKVLGRGGMGIVYEGRHVTVGRTVAIKVLRQDLARSTEAVQRFHREAKAAAAIGSEHIVEVFDFGYSDEGDAYIAMELLAGEDLGRIVRREGALPERRALGIVRQVAQALESAHAKGIIHRDLKSENVFVVQRGGCDFVKLLDFGISKVSEGEEGRGPMTSEGVVMGTPHYMAPEQAMSEVEPDHRLDIYALGCLMFEMLTGRVPFTGKNPVEVVFKHVHETAPLPRKLRPEISAHAEAVVLKALEKKREDRFEHAAAMMAALDDARFGADANALAAVEAKPAADASANADRGRSLRLGVGAVVVTLAAGLGVTWVMRGPARQGGGANNVVSTRADSASHVGSPIAAVDAASSTAHPTANADAHVAAPIVARDIELTVNATPRQATIEIDGEAAGTGTAHERFVRGTSHHVSVSAPGFGTETQDVVMDDPETMTVVLNPLPTNGVSRAVRDAGRVVRVEVTDAGARSTQTGDPGGDGLKGSPYGGGAL